MKALLRPRIVLFVSLVVILLGAAAVGYDYHSFLERPLPGSADRTLVIEEGMSAREVVDLLEAEGVLRNPLYLKYYLWHSGKGGELKPGVYKTDKALSPRALIELFTQGAPHGDSVVLWLQPGATLWDLALELERLDLADSQAFLRRALDPKHCAELGIPAKSLEGYLLAGKYPIERGLGVDAIIKLMHQAFVATWVELAQSYPEVIAARRLEGMGDHRLITLASLVEREVVQEDEAPVVARVFYNRLAIGMKLQTDPSCVYPPLEAGEKPTPSRCKDPKNSYSTYIIEGLPPGPIGAPSRASLAAVLRPFEGPKAETYLYFVARGDGSWRHYFSASFEEHKKAIAFFLKGRGTRPRTTPQPR